MCCLDKAFDLSAVEFVLGELVQVLIADIKSCSAGPGNEVLLHTVPCLLNEVPVAEE